MRSHVRTIVVLALAVGLVALFLHNVDLWRVWRANRPRRGRNGWRLSLATMFVNLAIRALRWQYLLEPLGAHELRERVSRDGGRVRGEQRAAGARGRGHSPVFPGASGARPSRQRSG